jgi:hypothetical protein
MYVAYVAMAIHVCCKCMFHMFKLFQTYVASVLSRCCIRMLQVFYLDVAYFALAIPYVASVSNVFRCLKCMLQMFYLDVAYIALTLYICCKCMCSNVSGVSNVCYKIFYLDVAYITVVIHICCKCMFVNVSFVSDVCCSECYTLQMLHDQAREVSADRSGPLVHAGSEVGAATHTCMRMHICTAAVGAAGPTGTTSATRGDNNNSSSTAQIGAAIACRQTGRSCMHALWGPPRQSGRRRYDAHVLSVSRMHPGKCVACAVSCRMQRERVRRVSRAVGAGVWLFVR